MTPRIEEKIDRFQIDKLEERIAPTGLGGLLNIDIDIDVDVDVSIGGSKGGGGCHPAPPPCHPAPPPCHQPPTCKW